MQIVDLIKYEGDNSTFVWKYPGEDFNTLSQLIVHESQEALFFLNGQALDLFGPGKHTLHTKNIPLLNKIINIPTGGESPFHCEVYFINKTEQMAIKWGMGDVNFSDPVHNNYVFKIGASGEMSLRISDSRKIITKLVGTETTLDQEKIKKFFKAPITMHIKTMLPQILKEKGVSIFDVETDLSELAKVLKIKISEEMSDYGVSLEKFWINTILKPETDEYYIKINRQRAEKIALANQGELDLQRADIERKVGIISHAGTVEQTKMDIDMECYKQKQLGYTYQQGRGFDVMEEVARNEGSGSDLRNAAMGVGMGFGVGGTFGDVIANISNNTMMPGLMEPANMEPVNSIARQGKALDTVPGMISLKEEMTESINEEGETDEDMLVFKKKVEKLVFMRDKGMVTDEEFSIQKRMLLKEIVGE